MQTLQLPCATSYLFRYHWLWLYN